MFGFSSRLVTLLSLVSTFIPSSLSLQTKVVEDSYAYNPSQLDGIQYSSDWQAAPTPSGHNNTLHVTDVPGSKLVYFFQGDSIYYYTDPSFHTATVRITLDNHLWEIRPSDLGTQPLVWSKTGLGPGDHQLIIRHVGSPGQSIALDNLRIDSSRNSALSSSGPSAPNVVGTTLIVDKTDAGLVYSGNWTALTAETFGTFYEGDAIQTQTSGSSVTFRFNGTAVWYYADTFQDFSGGTKISIDGEPAEMVYAYSNSPLLQHMIWSSTGLSKGEHTVLVEHTRSDTSYTSLSFFRYAPGEVTILAPEKPVLNTTTIVACAIGGVVLIALLFLIGVSFRRKRTVRGRCSPTPDLIGSMEDDYAPISPYQVHFPAPVVPKSRPAERSGAAGPSSQGTRGQIKEKHLPRPKPARLPRATRSANRLYPTNGDTRSFLSMGSGMSHISVAPLHELPPYAR